MGKPYVNPYKYAKASFNPDISDTIGDFISNMYNNSYTSSAANFGKSRYLSDPNTGINNIDPNDIMKLLTSNTTLLNNLKIGGKTLSQRDAARNKLVDQMTTAVTKSKGDPLVKNAANRVKVTTGFEAKKDNIISSYLADPDYSGQGMINMPNGYGDKMPLLKNGVIINPKVSTDATGAKINEINPNKLENKLTSKAAIGSTYNPSSLKPNTEMGFTTGDIVGLAGTAIGSISEMMNTIANAKATKPVVNHYMGFNEKSLANNNLAKDTLGYNQAQAKTELERVLQIGENTSRARVRGSASSMNTMRALDLGVDVNAGEAKAKGIAEINNSFNQQLMQLLGVDTQLLSEKDRAEMAGATAADDANAQNLDNFYTNFGQNIAGMTQNIQTVGKNINDAKSRRDFLKILPNTNPYGIGFDANMNPTVEKSVGKYTPLTRTITSKPVSTTSGLDFNTFDPEFLQSMFGKIPAFDFNNYKY